jgi:hypothetical protein
MRVLLLPLLPLLCRLLLVQLLPLQVQAHEQVLPQQLLLRLVPSVTGAAACCSC